jgi:hypothetical protein
MSASCIEVEGFISNEKPPYRVNLFYTGNFLSSRYPPDSLAVNALSVSIADDSGNKVDLFQTGPGIYSTLDTNYTGQIGRTYTLTIALADGKIFQSKPEMLLPVPEIEKLSAEFVQVLDRKLPSGYKVYVDVQDPAETNNYYRWSASGYSRRESTGVIVGIGGLCCTNCWQAFSANDVNIFSDANVNGNRIARHYVFFSPHYARGRQYVEVSQYSLTREAYQFWKRLEEQQLRTGSLFDPQPGQAEGNIFNTANPDELALGYFSSSAVTRKRLIMPGDTVRMFPDYYPEFIKNGACTFIYPSAQDLPPAW